MAILNFSLTPESTARVYEILVCLAKFGENVLFEVSRDKLNFTALNLSKTAYASFALDAKEFFVRYDFSASDVGKGNINFTCQLPNKALQSVFKGRSNDFRARDGAIERCDVSIQDQPDKAACRLIVRMICKHGMTKTYRLTYESAEVMHALFDTRAAPQGWKISARVLREYIEFFGPKTEQLAVVATDGKAVFTSFTEKIQDGKEVLKQALETAVTIHKEDFDDFHMQEDMHIVISVKDFKAIVTHAETVRASITALFSFPSRPLQFSYENYGIRSEFTLVTTGDFRGASATPAPVFVSTRASSRQPSASLAPPTQQSTTQQSVVEMPPPPRRANLNRPLGSQNQRSADRVEQVPITKPIVEESESLFLPLENEDQSWDPANYANDEEEEMLGWDTSIDTSATASFHPTFRDSGAVAPSQQQNAPTAAPPEEGLEPTQRLSQLHGMFD